MKDVGEFDKRNIEFEEKFDREIIIKKTINVSNPTIFDIGGHIGQSIDYLKRIFPNSNMYSFEPDPDSFKELQKKNSKSVKVFNIAISDKEGKVIFFKNNISHTNSIYKINLDSVDSIKATKERALNNSTYKNEINKEIEVESTTLKKFTDDNNISHIDLLKIDVQGAEDSVLRGADLSIVDNIIVEISLYDFYEKSSNFSDIEKILLPKGFYLHSILDISHNPMNGRTDWVEAMYKKIL
jgi:FkbM family methyltransferase